MAEFWGALGHLTVFWHRRVKCEPALAHIHAGQTWVGFWDVELEKSGLRIVSG